MATATIAYYSNPQIQLGIQFKPIILFEMWNTERHAQQQQQYVRCVAEISKSANPIATITIIGMIKL